MCRTIKQHWDVVALIVLQQLQQGNVTKGHYTFNIILTSHILLRFIIYSLKAQYLFRIAKGLEPILADTE